MTRFNATDGSYGVGSMTKYNDRNRPGDLPDCKTLVSIAENIFGRLNVQKLYNRLPQTVFSLIDQARTRFLKRQVPAQKDVFLKANSGKQIDKAQQAGSYLAPLEKRPGFRIHASDWSSAQNAE